jgi:hypothetical protein
MTIMHWHRGLARIDWRMGQVHRRAGLCLLMMAASGMGLLPAAMSAAGTAPLQVADEPPIPGQPVRAAGAAVVDFRQLVEMPQPVTGPTEAVIPFVPQIEAPSAGDIILPAGGEAD